MIALSNAHSPGLQIHDDPEIWRLVDRVSFVEKDEYNDLFSGERCADVTLVTRNGRRLQSATAVARGNYDAPLPDDEILQKLEQYADTVLAADARLKIAGILNGPARELTPAVLISLLQP